MTKKQLIAHGRATAKKLEKMEEDTPMEEEEFKRYVEEEMKKVVKTEEDEEHWWTGFLFGDEMNMIETLSFYRGVIRGIEMAMQINMEEFYGKGPSGKA